MEAPTRKSDNYWVYQVRLMGGDREATLDLSACYPGAKTRWIGEPTITLPILIILK